MNNVNIKDIIDNYNYLKSYELMNINKLNNLLFGEYISKNEDIERVINESLEVDEILPEYCDLINIKSTKENQLLLRDKFVYFLVNSIDDDKLNILDNDKLKSIKAQDENNNFNDYALIYPSYNKLLKDRKYKDYFLGISNKLFKLLNGINSDYYEKISNLDDNVIEFIDSLDTIKNWDSLDELERKEKLINEFIGRLLYASVDYASTKYSDYISKKEFIKTGDFFDSLKNLKLTNNLLDKAKEIDNNNELVINKVIELYPYSVEIFDKKYTSIAEDYGYKLNDKLINCVYYQFNDINIKLIPENERETYLNNLINIFYSYKNTKDDNNLYNYLIGLDTFIRNINYYDKDISKYNDESYEIFNKEKYKNIDRIKYILKLIKKYYDSSLNINLGLSVIDIMPIGPIDLKREKYEKIEELKEAVIILYKKYDFNIIELNDIIDKKGSLYNKIIDFYNNNELLILSNSLINSPELDELFDNLILITNLDALKRNNKDILFEDSSNILIMLKKLCDANKIIRDYINVFLLEKRVMELIENV